MDDCKRRFIESKAGSPELFIRGEIYFYAPILFVAEGIDFNNVFLAVKVYKTTIVLFNHANGIRVHFSDEDIRAIVQSLKVNNPDFHNYLSLYIENIISKKDLSDITFRLNARDFIIRGIPFERTFSEILCNNPADITLNGNDLIGLINLIIEKERTDKDINKVTNTCKYFLGV